MARAVFVSGPAKRRWVRANQLPLVLDGGCGVIYVTFDVI
jgi:hypothetical protein